MIYTSKTILPASLLFILISKNTLGNTLALAANILVALTVETVIGVKVLLKYANIAKNKNVIKQSSKINIEFLS